LLSDFPELWAIERLWKVGPNIPLPTVETVTDELLNDLMGYQQWHVVTESETDLWVGPPLGYQPTSVLRSFLRDLFSFDPKMVIKYVVSVRRGQGWTTITIYKPPKGRTISDLIADSK
jgi:hypothetical protein